MPKLSKLIKKTATKILKDERYREKAKDVAKTALEQANKRKKK